MISATELGEHYRSGELSPVEVTSEALRKAEEVQPQINAFIELLPERAHARARASEERHRHGRTLGPLDGVPVAIKDLIDIAGVRTTAASKVLLDNVARSDAAVVQQLESAGAVIIGKANLHEFAYGGTGHLSYFGPCRNPRNPDHVAGGSSSGSAAAVAAGVCPIGIGTDTGGSVRIPAAACGLVGLKPTYGRVSTGGVIPLSWSLDHVGVITSTVEDAGLALAGLCDFVPPAYEGSPTYPLRIGIVCEHYFEHLDLEVRRSVEQALPRLGNVVDLNLPHGTWCAPVQAVITAAEAAAYHRHWLATRADDYEPGIRNRLVAALQVTGADYVQALRLRGLMVEEMFAAFDRVDVLAMPTLPIPAPTLYAEEATVEDGSLNVIAALIRNTGPINVTGFPAISIPCGETSTGLPVGLQLVAPPWREAHLLRVAHLCACILAKMNQPV